MVRGRADQALDAAALELAVSLQYQEEITKLKMQLVVYRDALIEAGLSPPDKDGEDLLEMWRVCFTVIRAAHDCVASLGTSKELILSGRRLPNLDPPS